MPNRSSKPHGRHHPRSGPPPGCPAHAVSGRIPLYGPELAAEPQAYYAYLRHYGPTAPIERAPGVDATLVTDYTTALHLLQDNGRAPVADPQRGADPAGQPRRPAAVVPAQCHVQRRR